MVSAALALACAGCADTYGPSQYAGVYSGYPDYAYPYYEAPYSYYPYYAAPFVGLGAGAIVFSDHHHHDDFDHFHRFGQNRFGNPGNAQRTAPMSLGAAISQGVHAAPPPAPAPAPAPHASSLGAALRLLSHQ
jgi:hypothetical protein